MTQLDLPFTSSPFDAIRHEDTDGEYWLARELMPLLGYGRWNRVPDVIDRASAACSNSGHDADQHFRASSSHYHPRTGELVLDPPQPRVTLKGLQELHRRLGGTNDFRSLLPDEER